MSRPANPYDKAQCESFIKTLKREEIYAQKYQEMADPRTHMEEFIKVHSATSNDGIASESCYPESRQKQSVG
jgi:transposase InsO family protein